MEAGNRITKRKLWLYIVNVVVIAAMVFTLAAYATSNAREEEKNTRETLLESTAKVSDSVRLFFVSQHRSLYNHHCYISPPEGENLSYDEALLYLQKANSDAAVNYQLIDPVSYSGVSLINGGLVEVTYTHDTYLSIRKACDIVAAGDIQYDVISSTSVFANSSNGAAASIALYTDAVVDMGGRDKSYVLLAVIETGNLLYSGLPRLAYPGAGACIIDKNGDYIVKDDEHFRNSENFFKFLRIYNSLTYPEMDAASEELRGGVDGILEYDNYSGEDCFFPYHAISGTDGWYYVASVPVASAAPSNFDYVFTLILLLFLGVLITLNGLWMKYLNSLLRSNVKSLDEARRTADAANEAKSSFLARMSHEMRTPLNAIIGLGELAREKSSNPEVQALLSKMDAASAHLLGIINDVLDISKIGEGMLMLHLEPFTLSELTDVLSTIYGISAGESGVSLLFQTDVATDRYLIGDRLRLRQIMTNLISNAIKYNRSGGFAKVEIRQLGDAAGDRVRIRFQIEDDGLGISEENQRAIFEPFLRDYTDETKAIAGTGLGLAISAELVQAMGGEIKLESRLGEGSRFYFELEFELGGKVLPRAETVKPHWDSQSLRDIRVLVAEDNEMNAFIVENFLRRGGAVVTIVTNGREALEKIRDEPEYSYDIILMDILMPIMDGYEAVRRIRELETDYAKTIPIAALSANAFNEDVETSLARGMQAHLAKPINVDALYQTIIDLTRGKQ